MSIGTKVFPGLHVGDGDDLESLLLDRPRVDVNNHWFILHAAKLPWHKNFCGYTGRGAPKEDPEYYVARRDNRMALNLIDVENVDWMPPPIFDAALAFITEGLETGKNVLVHCNQGGSRAPAIALLWLHLNVDGWRVPFEEAEEKFLAIYPAYAPAGGPREYVRRAWQVVTA